MSLKPFVGTPHFFVEWRVATDNPTWLIEEWQVPVVVVAGGNGSGFYHTAISDGLSLLWRSWSLPLAFAEFDPGIAHTYRLELDTDQLYLWYVDGALVGMGVPEGAYPDESSSLTWGASRDYVDAATRWDFVRFGRIPFDGSGDYDTDFDVDLADYYFVHDCLTKEGPGLYGGPVAAGDGLGAGPGCKFADFAGSGDFHGEDPDGDVDLRDFAAFQNHFVVCVCCDPPICDLFCCP